MGCSPPVSIQKVIKTQKFSYPVWLIGRSATFGVRSVHDIDLAFPLKYTDGTGSMNFADKLNSSISPVVVSHDKVPLWNFLINKKRAV
jgi:hypothetical protein